MSEEYSARLTELLESLLWDTEHFGLSVARITSPDLDDGALRMLLKFARETGIDWVYWATHPERSVPQELLIEFRGALVDRKATFLADRSCFLSPTAGPCGGEFEVVEYPVAPACERLLSLAVQAGSHSRFCVDPRVNPERFRSLYERWMNGSTQRQLADAVFVAISANNLRDVVGMVTVSQKQDHASIGLIAVHETSRGRGIGTLLMRAAHRWMVERGVGRATVVTQLTNRDACRLYERSGYCLYEQTNFYHFWPCP